MQATTEKIKLTGYLILEPQNEYFQKKSPKSEKI